MKAGIYFDLKEGDYHADPCAAPSLSASIAKLLLTKSPLHAWHAHPQLNPNFQEKNEPKFDIGKAVHSLILGDDRQFEIVEANDWRTKAAQEKRDAAYAAGKTPLLSYKFEELKKMAAAARVQLDAHEAKNAFASGHSEVTVIWQEGDIWCRCRIDHCAENGTDFYDFKSTEASANPENVSRLFFSLGYDITHSFYKRGIRKILGIDNPTYRFVMQELYEPHALSVIGIDPASEHLADRKVDEAIRLWGLCMENKFWPGYPNRTAYIGAPAYHEKEWLEREERESAEREEIREQPARAINF